jgi:carbamoyl-phosphate synthase small subunit
MTSPSLNKRAPSLAREAKPKDATGVLVLSDGSIFWGKGLGAEGSAVGELCFNTSMTGYQEITTDPSYAGQIITFTFPHIGNVGINMQDVETKTPFVRGVVLREAITTPANWRAAGHLEDWLERSNLIGLSGVDTRALTIRIRDLGAPNAIIAHQRDGKLDVDALAKQAKAWPGLDGMDLAREVTCAKSYEWNEGIWRWYPEGHGAFAKGNAKARFHIVAIDYGAKHNILRCLVNEGCSVTVVPATVTADIAAPIIPSKICTRVKSKSPAKIMASSYCRKRCPRLPKSRISACSTDQTKD